MDFRNLILATLSAAAVCIEARAGCPGNFTIALEVPRVNSERPTLADINGDGRIDLLTLDGTGMLRVRRASGNSFEAPQSLQLPPHSYIKSVRDLDGDGAPDLLISCTYGWNCGSNLVRIYWNSPSSAQQFSGTNTELSLPASPYCIEADTIDFDGDGLHDVIITSMLNTVRLHRNTGARQFSVQSNMNWPRDLYYRSTVDIDGDGKADFMAMHKSGWADGAWGAYLYRGNGLGGFSAPIVDFAAERTAAGFSVDLNGPSVPGVAVAVYAGNSIGQTLRIGSWSPAAARIAYQSVQVPAPFYAYQGHDVDGDGEEDLLLTASGADAGLAYMLNGGTGAFLASPVAAVNAPGFEFSRLASSLVEGRRHSLVAATSTSLLRVYRATCTFDTCRPDLNNDGQVDGVDLGIILGAWGSGGGTYGADLTQDGSVDGNDLGIVLGSWGACPN